MRQTPLVYTFILALLATFFATAFFPNIRLMTFAPFLALLYNRRSLLFSLWIAALSGLVLDLFSSQMRFGFFSLSYTLSSLLLYKQKRHFFDDKPQALALFTALISSVITLVQLFLNYAFDRQIHFSSTLILSDLLCMPLLDALYAFLWFTLPIRLYAHIRTVGWKHFFSRLLKNMTKLRLGFKHPTDP